MSYKQEIIGFTMGSASFSAKKDANKKLFFLIFSAYYFLKVHFYIIFLR